MNIKDLAPWFVTAAAVAVAVSSWTDQRPAAPPAPQLDSSQVIASAATAEIDDAALARAVRQAVRAELAADQAREDREDDARTVAAEFPDPTPQQLDALDEGLMIVDDLRSYGDATPEEIHELVASLNTLDRAEGERLLSAYFNALNSGEIAVTGSPLAPSAL